MKSKQKVVEGVLLRPDGTKEGCDVKFARSGSSMSTGQLYPDPLMIPYEEQNQIGQFLFRATDGSIDTHFTGWSNTPFGCTISVATETLFPTN